MNGIKKLLCVVLSLVPAGGMLTALPAAAGTTPETTAVELEEGTYVPHQVLVMFRQNAVKESETTLSAAQRMEHIGEDFGGAMQSTSETAEAAGNA